MQLLRKLERWIQNRCKAMNLSLDDSLRIVPSILDSQMQDKNAKNKQNLRWSDH